MPIPDELLIKFGELCEEVRRGKAGRDFSVEPEEDYKGYDWTDVESRLADCVKEIIAKLEQDPDNLEAQDVERMVPGMVELNRGFDSYRARSIAAAGDYDDFNSPIKETYESLERALRDAIRDQEERDIFILNEVPERTLTLKMGQVPAYRLLLSSSMKSRPDLFAAEDEQRTREMQTQIERLPELDDKWKRIEVLNKVDSLSSVAFPELYKLAIQTFARALADPEKVVRDKAEVLISESPTWARVGMERAWAEEQAPVRLALAPLISRLARDRSLYNSEFKRSIQILLIRGLQDPDPAVREICSEELSEFNKLEMECLPEILEIIGSEDESVRHAGRNLDLKLPFRKYNNPKSFLEPYLEHENPLIKIFVAQIYKRYDK